MRTAYIIAAWGGPRRGQPESVNWLEKHLSHLRNLKHDCDVVVVSPDCNESFSSYVDSLKVRVIRRENNGLSYGSWAAAYEEIRGEYSHYIFTEDDWVPVLDRFDEILRSKLSNHGYLCQYLSVSRRIERHGAISCGIASSRALESVWRENGGSLPFQETSDEIPYKGNGGQVMWTTAFWKAGFRMACLTNDHGYKSVYWGNGFAQIIENKKSPGTKGFFFLPVQALVNKDQHSRPYMRRRKSQPFWPLVVDLWRGG